MSVVRIKLLSVLGGLIFENRYELLTELFVIYECLY